MTQSSSRFRFSVGPTPDADPTFVYRVLRAEEQFILGALSWTVGGRTENGPEVEFSVMDAILRPSMFEDFANGLLIASKPPI